GLLWTHCFQGETGSRETCRESSTAGQGEFAATRVLAAGQQVTVVVGMKKGVAGDVAPILRAKPRTFLEYFSVEPLTVGSALLLLLLGAAWLGRMVWRRGRDMEYASAFYSTKDPTERVRPLFRPEAVVPEYRPPDNLLPAEMVHHGSAVDASALGVAGRPGCGGRCGRYLGPGGAGRLGPAGDRRHPDRRGDDRGQPLDAAPDRTGHRPLPQDAGIPPLHDP